MCYTKKQFDMLLYLYDNEATNKIKSCTLKKISSETGIHYQTLNTAKKIFIEHGYISEGIPDGTAKTYFITENGISEIDKMK